MSGSSKTRLLCSVFLCLNQLIISCPFCCVVRGSTGLMGVRSLLKDLSGTVCRWGDVSTLRGNVLSTVRPLGLGEEFRDDERFSNTEGGWSKNRILAGSGGVSRSIKIPTGVGGFTGSSGESGGNSKVSLRFVIKEEILRLEPPSPNRIECSDGSIGFRVVDDGSSRSRSRLKSDKSVGGSSRSRVFLRLGGVEEVFSNPRTILLRKDVGEEGFGDWAVG